MPNFTCKQCGKQLDLEQHIYDKAYKNHDFCLDCRSIEKSMNHGGKRERSGRPSLGTTKKVSITLPNEVWEQLDDARGNQPMSAKLREIIMNGNWV